MSHTILCLSLFNCCVCFDKLADKRHSLGSLFADWNERWSAVFAVSLFLSEVIWYLCLHLLYFCFRQIKFEMPCLPVFSSKGTFRPSVPKTSVKKADPKRPTFRVSRRKRFYWILYPSPLLSPSVLFLAIFMLDLFDNESCLIC